MISMVQRPPSLEKVASSCKLLPVRGTLGGAPFQAYLVVNDQLRTFWSGLMALCKKLKKMISKVQAAPTREGCKQL
jgi:hypothetical protein